MFAGVARACRVLYRSALDLQGVGVMMGKGFTSISVLAFIASGGRAGA
jgi:hypothetical protein